MPNKLPIDQLKRIAGKDNLVVESERVSIFPESSRAASEVVKLATAERFQILPLGSGSILNSSRVHSKNVVFLKSDRLNQVVKVVPEDLYVILQAGFPLRELNRHLESHNLFYPLSDGEHSGTIGGSVAANLGGRSADRNLQTRDYVLAVQVVDAQGQILNVGAKTFKSVTGYDLPRLFTGSWGTLGVLTEITLRVIPARKRKDYPGVTVVTPKVGKGAGADDPKTALSLRIKESLDPTGVFVSFESLV